MNYNKKVLILMEGKAEKAQFLSLSNTFGELLKEGGFEPIVLGTSIYELYQPLLESGQYDDLPSYLCSIGKIRCAEGERPKDLFSLIYLIFDFDPQYQKFSRERIKRLAEYFSDETRNGLLYINYPMVEAMFDVIDIKGSPQIPSEHPLSLCTSENYKRWIKQNTIFRSDEDHAFSKLNSKAFSTLGQLTLSRYKELMNDHEDGWYFTNGLKLLNKECEGAENGLIYPLSCFPLMALDYNAEATLHIWKQAENHRQSNL